MEFVSHEGGEGRGGGEGSGGGIGGNFENTEDSTLLWI